MAECSHYTAGHLVRSDGDCIRSLGVAENTILAPVLLLIDLVTGDFTQLASDAENIWQNIQDAASQIWSGIQQVVTSFAEGLVTHGHSGYRIYGHLVKFVGHDKADGAQYLGKFEKFCGSNSNKFERFCNPGATEPERICIPEVAGNEAERTRQLGEFKEQCGPNRTKSERVSGAGVPQHGFRNRKRTEQSGINCAERILVSNQLYHITAKPGSTVGRDFIDGIVSGIRNAIGRVRDAVSDVASTIRSFLHFSVPDEGPLTEYESWMPDFMQGLAKGIEKSKSVVADAIEGVSKDMTINANAMMDQSNAKQTNAIMNITSLLAQYLPYLAKSLNIEWDTGGVAAKLARDMDRELGILAEEGGFL